MPNIFSEKKITPVNLPSQVNGIDWEKLLGPLAANKWLIIFITVTATTAGTAAAFLGMPIYKADVLLQVENKTSAAVGVEQLAALLNSEAPVMADIELIKSRMTLGTVVKNLDLEVIAKPRYFPVIGEAIARRFEEGGDGDEVSSALFGLSGYAWGGETIHVDTFTVPAKWLDKELILIAGKQSHFQLMHEDRLVLEGEVGLLASKQLDDQEQSFNLLISLLKARPDTQFSLMRQSEANAIGYLQDAIAATEKGKKSGILELTIESTSPNAGVRTINAVADVYVRQNDERNSTEVQTIQKQLPQPKEQLQSAATVINDDSIGSVSGADVKTPGISVDVAGLKAQIKQLQENRHELRQRFSKSHPAIASIDRKIVRLQGQLNANDKKTEIQKPVPELANAVNINTVLDAAPGTIPLSPLTSKNRQSANVRIIDYALLPVEPVKPKKALVIFFSFMAGVILGVALAYIRKLLHRGVEDPDLIEKLLDIPVFATIPHSAEQQNISVRLRKNRQNHELSVLALENKNDPAIESLRSLRTALHFAFLEAQNNIIMISSPSPGVGKSFVAINLAVVLADAGKKVLLIDGDLRKGYLNTALGISRANGLSEFILNAITLDVAIQKMPEVNFDFIATGSIPPNPSELLLHERFGIFLDNISKHYDHIIIDTPPILAVTDAAIIGLMANATLLVIRAGQHPKRELEQSTKRLLQAGVDIKGIVFNDVPESLSRYGYGKYVYQFSYQK